MTITEMLGIQYPLFSGAMMHIANHKLVGAVSEAGGLGILASAGLTADELRVEIVKTRELTDKPFGVNLMLQMKNCPELAQVIIDEGVKVVTTGAGNPASYIGPLHAAGIKVIPVIASVHHALKMTAAGADAVVAEGQESGGHIGQTSTMALLPQVVDAVDIPVIGAGGVGDGRSVAAMFALGASGVQCGTIFLTAAECPVADAYKQRVLAASDTDTIVTGRAHRDPVRALRNPMLEHYLQLERAAAPVSELKTLADGSFERAVDHGDVDGGTPMAGEVAGMFTQIRPAKEIIETLFSQANQVAASLTV
ncbi:enoyl-[acyl-carrier-protein] reductase FabK [Lactiplantibacillus garii]|uniref:Probable nitronate monooxygenase n=1 Tax=Lactiplantibacillus garii TaxID=2306423 RepID=A0A3R8J6T4_9LACO|nr:nitronate monooxygenase [Lactiplantibacillus garii]RRK10303.1 enoyl-[acyl-carrier-protein] reductase FabK [Lactiplantibacillus garii]